jgi:hypothetical protein
MHLDNTKHKVYIYDLDAELSDSDASDDGRLVFLPDIQRHLRETRIPPAVLANSEGELAGMNKQLVLYNVPSSLSIPEEQDSVRKAIIEARARVRAKHQEKRDAVVTHLDAHPPVPSTTDAHDWYREIVNRMKSNGVGIGSAQTVVPGDMEVETAQPTYANAIIEDDPDAMDIG